MLKSGKEYLETLRDGRVIYLGGEKVLTGEEDGERCSAYYLRATSKAGLVPNWMGRWQA